jgi:hypothetical protein|nr:MAG TPA: helix-turn-helix domain protein [Caudoviricetes sp.]
MREAQNTKVWKYLQEHKSITAYEMFEKFNICHPPARIRDLRKKYGYDTISGRWVKKTKKEVDSNGKEHKVTVRYLEYFLSKMEGLA